MIVLLQWALAPIIVCAVYMFVRDKYEKEPFRMLLLGLLFGVYSTFVILMTGNILEKIFPHEGTFWAVFFNAFITSAAVEEGTKFLFLFLLIWKNKNFNEPFDGIVYAVFISLGFAMLENIIYIFDERMGGLPTALARAVFSVPGHFFFGVAMGYYIALAKYEPNKRVKYTLLSFIVPYLFHSFYNLILLLELNWYMVLLVPFVALLWLTGFRKMKHHIEVSPFKK